MRIRRLLQSALFLLAGNLLVSCQSPAHTATGTADPAQLLAGNWGSRKAGDSPKFFIHGPHTYQYGELRGFWPEGGRYEVTRANAATSTLHVSASSLRPEMVNVAHSFEADIQFDAKGHMMTMLRYKPNGLTETLVFERLR